MNPEAHCRYQHERELDVLRAARRLERDARPPQRRLTRRHSVGRTEEPALARPAVPAR